MVSVKKKSLVVGIIMVIVSVLVIMYVLLNGNAETAVYDEIVQIMTEYNANYEGIELTEPMEIAVHEIYYGSFSKESADEMLVICKVLNAPHVAGLDKTICAVLQTESLELVAYEQFPADKVVIECVQNSSGQDRILVSCVSGSQGIYTQTINLFAIEDSQWVSIPQDVWNAFGDEDFYFIGENCIIVSSSARELNAEEIITILHWDEYTEQFIEGKTEMF